MNRESILAATAVLILRFLFLFVRIRYVDGSGIAADPSKKPIILCFWHNRILGITACFLRKYPHGRRRGVTVLTSPSRDGEILAQVMNRLGMGAVRGSSSRRGFQALRELVREVEAGGDIAITPDGPRGPRYRLGPGALALAQATGSPLALAHAHFSRCRRMKTWDGFIIPLPFSTISIKVDEPIFVPKDLTDGEFEAFRIRIETILKNEAD